MMRRTRFWSFVGTAGLLAGVAGSFGGAASAATGTIAMKADTSNFSFGGGGEFKVIGYTGPALTVPCAPANNVTGSFFQTFCLEKNVSFIEEKTYSWSSSSFINGNAATPLPPEVAYLYFHFWKGDLANYSLTLPRTTQAGNLQMAIWSFVGDFDINAAPGQAQAFYNEAAAAVANNTWTGLGGVQVLTLVDPVTNTAAQDVLILLNSPPPPPPADCVMDSSIKSEFNGTAILAGNCIWFNSHFKLKGAGNHLVTVLVTDVNVSSPDFNLDLPDALVTFNPAATTATTTFNAGLNRWETTVPSSFTSDVFMSGGFLHLPTGLKGGVKNVFWSATFHINTPVPVNLSWQWAAAAYKSGACDVPYGDLCVKPVESNSLSAYKNSDQSGTPECVKTLVTGGARGGGGSNFTGSWSGTASFNCD